MESATATVKRPGTGSYVSPHMLIRRPGGEWQKPKVSAFPNEADLQKMIAQSPSLLPKVKGPVVVAREFRCKFGSIDIVGVDLSGQIIVCECKTARNEKLRRKVVGQIFAYAAGLWELSWETFARRFERSSGTPLVDRAHALADEAGEDDWDEETFRQETAKSLEAGDFRLVLAVEAIPDELREIVRFVNVHSASGIEVLALELSYRRDGEVEILVPHTWGEEIVEGRGDQGVLDREALLAAIAKDPPAAKAAEAVLEWVGGKERLRVRYTANGAHIETHPARQRFLRVSKRGNIRVWLRTLRKHGPWDHEGIEQLVQDLARIGVELDPTSDQPKVPVESLANDAQRQEFFKRMEKVLDTLTGSG